MIATQARNASLEDLVQMLTVQHDAQLDAVVPATKIRMLGTGMLEIPSMGMDGPAGGSGYFRATDIFDEGLAEKLKIPLAYVRRLRSDYPSLLSRNVNDWLQGSFRENEPEPEGRKFLVRTFTDTRAPDGGPGIARCLMGDGYRVIDNLDVVTAALSGIRDSGADAYVEKAQITDRRMSVDVVCEQIGVIASALLRDYRNPFDHEGIQRAGGWSLDQARRAAASEGSGYAPGSEPMLWAGFTFSNSETGGGAYSLAPRIVFSPCGNGLKLTREMVRQVHIGARLDEGVINWSDATREKNLELVKSMTADAVRSWLDEGFVRKFVDELERKSANVDDAAAVVQLVGQRLAFTESERNEVLKHFIAGGQLSTLGVLNAVTSVAQTVASPDRATELEDVALEALDIAYAAVS